MLNAIVAHDTDYRNFGFNDLTPDEIAEFEAWSLEANQGTRDLEPQDLARRLYDDLDIWEIDGYGRVYLNREGCWVHNGPRPKKGFDHRYHETREGAIASLIQAVHLALDHVSGGHRYEEGSPF